MQASSESGATAPLQAAQTMGLAPAVQSTPPAHAAPAGPIGLGLAVDGVDLRFGGIHALRNVSFQATPGQVTAVIGPNGAGKTSVFNTISGFYRPSAGNITLGGADITAVPVHARAAMGLARTFQNIALFRGLSVLENIKLGGHHTMKAGLWSSLTYGPRARNEEMALREEVGRKVIEFLEIDHIRHRSVDALPYGLQKRVELARALAMRPRVLMLDEPVAGMNREETEDMARFILDVQEEGGRHHRGRVPHIAGARSSIPAGPVRSADRRLRRPGTARQSARGAGSPAAFAHADRD